MARGRRPALALDVDQARAARPERRPIGVLAQLGQRDLERVDRIEDTCPGRDLDLTIIHDHSHEDLTVSVSRGWEETFRDIFVAGWRLSRRNGARATPRRAIQAPSILRHH